MARKQNKNFHVLQDMDPIEEFEGNDLLNLFDPDNPDIGFFNLLDEENIRLAGSPLLYYKYYQSDQQFSEVYREAREKPIARQAITVNGHYEPTVIEEQLSEFGIELQNDQMFTFNKSYIEKRLGRLPIPGDIVRPKFQDIKYELIEVQEDSFLIYGVYHVICSAKVFRDTSEAVDERHVDPTDPLGGYGKT